jgi:hypothetical protein
MDDRSLSGRHLRLVGPSEADGSDLRAAIDVAVDLLDGRDPEEAGAPPQLVPLLRAVQQEREAAQALQEAMREANR